jgi:hypothetical protein
MKLFTIYDSKVDTHGPILGAQNSDEMIRMTLRNYEGSLYEQFPEDYTLLEIGSYDEVTGTITPYSSHRSICRLDRLGNARQGNNQTES